MPTSGAPGQEQEASTNSASSLAAVFASNPTAGKGVVAAVLYSANRTISSVVGCGGSPVTLAREITNGDLKLAVYVIHNCSGSNKTVTVTFSGAAIAVLKIVEWPSIDLAAAVDVTDALFGLTSSIAGAPFPDPAGVVPAFSNASQIVFMGTRSLLADTSVGTNGSFTNLTSKEQTGGSNGTATMRARYRTSAGHSVGSTIGTLVADVAAAATAIVGTTASGLALGGYMEVDPSGGHPEIVKIGNIVTPSGGTQSTISFSPALAFAHLADAPYAVPTKYATGWGVNEASKAWLWVAVSLKGKPNAAVTGTATFAGTAGGRADGIRVVPQPLPLLVEVWDGNNPLTTRIRHISRWRDLQTHDVHNDIGAGSLRLPLAVGDATASVLADGNLWRIHQGPFDIFDFWNETPAYTLASPDGAAGESVLVAGRGMEAYLEDAVVYPARLGVAQQAAYQAIGSAGSILRTLIATAQARGALNLITCDFDANVDSAGVAWTTTLQLNLALRTNYRDVVGEVRKAGVVAELRGDFVLRMWQSYGRNLASSVMLRQARQIAGAIDWTKPAGQKAAVVLVEGANGTFVEVTDGSYSGRRKEAALEATDAATTATITAAGTADIAKRNLASSAIQVPVHHGMDAPLYEPYRHYLKGDSPAIDVPRRINRTGELVSAINLAAADAARYAVTLDLNGVQPDPAAQLWQRVGALERP